MPLGVFVAFVQTFVFILLSQLYLSEVSHAPHDEHDEHTEQEIGGHASLDQRAPLAVS
jgi:hypothetical protein